MTTTMRRLQISLPRWERRFLAERAHRSGVSVAEVVRRLVRAEAAGSGETAGTSIWDVVGIADDAGRLIDGVPVSEAPERYVVAGVAREGGRAQAADGELLSRATKPRRRGRTA